MRVLFVEDDEVLAELMRVVLEDDGHVPVRARRRRGGRRGPLGRRSRQRPTGVVGRPGRRHDGAQLRALAVLAPVVLVADRPWMEDARPADLGVAAIVPKPFELDDLLAAVRAAGGRR